MLIQQTPHLLPAFLGWGARFRGFVVRLLCVDVHPSALKHGVVVEDIEHAVRNAMAIDELEDDLCLYLGPGRDGSMLEVMTLAREDDDEEVVIHAMAMRPRYRRLLPGGR